MNCQHYPPITWLGSAIIRCCPYISLSSLVPVTCHYSLLSSSSLFVVIWQHWQPLLQATFVAVTTVSCRYYRLLFSPECAAIRCRFYISLSSLNRIIVYSIIIVCCLYLTTLANVVGYNIHHCLHRSLSFLSAVIFTWERIHPLPFFIFRFIHYKAIINFCHHRLLSLLDNAIGRCCLYRPSSSPSVAVPIFRCLHLTILLSITVIIVCSLYLKILWTVVGTKICFYHQLLLSLYLSSVTFTWQCLCRYSSLSSTLLSFLSSSSVVFTWIRNHSLLSPLSDAVAIVLYSQHHALQLPSFVAFN